MERSERCDNFMKCIDAFIKSVQDKPGSCRSLSKSHPGCFAKCPEELGLISDQLWKNFGDNLKAHAMALIEELNLETLLNQLDEAGASNSGWQHSGNPRNDAQRIMASMMEKELATLQELTQSFASEIDGMRSELHERESRIAKLLKESEEQVDQLEQLCDPWTQLMSSSSCDDVKRQ